MPVSLFQGAEADLLDPPIVLWVLPTPRHVGDAGSFKVMKESTGLHTPLHISAPLVLV